MAFVRRIRDLQARDEPQRGDDRSDVLRESLDAVEGGERLDWHLAGAVSAGERLHEPVAPQVGVGEVERELLDQGLAGLAGGGRGGRGWLHLPVRSRRFGDVFG